ncbi:TniQ family protein [Leisingera sp. S132]|uniref:TniQ family protein n=1 Tax=Leisingera sp. S132 TaxID=2867016 RepID=UPI0021A6F787|nr:TniQ family protein [Leisingera sp. S132]UWQ81321.1 TniQ family protein [Leisingera sp. S132]
MLSRLAARNGAISMQRFCGDIAFPIDSLFRGERVAIKQLAQLAGCDVTALERVSIRHLGKGHFRLRDEFASLQSFQRSHIRVCPECIRTEMPSAAESWRVPRRLQWKFSSIRSCPKHSSMLACLPAEKFNKDARDFAAQLTLLRKSVEGQGSPFPRRTYPTASVTGMPSAVNPFMTATRS